MLYTPALCYGRTHESEAVSAYIEYQRDCCGVAVEVRVCGLVVDLEFPWLAASPDRIVIDPSENKEKKQGCLEVKCPLSCQKMTIVEACRKVSAFCLIEEDGGMFLSRSHAYFYQVQTEMHVTNCKCCDFVVWSPLHQPFIQCVSYDPKFMKMSIMKAHKFHFDQFLPAVLPYIISPSKIVSSSSSSTIQSINKCSFTRKEYCNIIS